MTSPAFPNPRPMAGAAAALASNDICCAHRLGLAVFEARSREASSRCNGALRVMSSRPTHFWGHDNVPGFRHDRQAAPFQRRENPPLAYGPAPESARVGLSQTEARDLAAYVAQAQRREQESHYRPYFFPSLRLKPPFAVDHITTAR